MYFALWLKEREQTETIILFLRSMLSQRNSTIFSIQYFIESRYDFNLIQY